MILKSYPPHAFLYTAVSLIIAYGIDLGTTAAGPSHVNENTATIIYAHQISLDRATVADVCASVFASL